ncbi:MAG: hypothetical protein HY830_26055 [Actinobacteria bacterium]|nr:hypothetical protein [Actinomycetota bacterium]
MFEHIDAGQRVVAATLAAGGVSAAVRWVVTRIKIRATVSVHAELGTRRRPRV